MKSDSPPLVVFGKLIHNHTGDTMFTCIGFWDGEFGQAVVDVLTNTEGSVMYGPTVPSIAATVDFLSQWDYGDEHVVVDTGAGTSDIAIDWEGYILTYNSGLGYVALYRPTEHNIYESISYCLVCGEHIEFCTGHGADTEDMWERAENERGSLLTYLGILTEDM